MSEFRRCEDSHRCENGSSCKENPNDEGSFFCDCSTAIGDFAGLYCEYEADIYCTFPQELSSTWFCANDGTCVVDIEPVDSQFTCDCTDEYDGRHCEFVKGAAPADWPTAFQTSTLKNSSSDKGLEAGIKVAIALVVCIVFGLVALIVIQKRRGGDGYLGQNSMKDPSQALQIDADGDVLQEAVKSLTNSHHSSQHNGEYDFENPIFDNPEEISVEVEHTKSPSQENGTSNGRGGQPRII